MPRDTNPKMRNTADTTAAAIAITEVLPVLVSVSIATNLFFVPCAGFPPLPAGTGAWNVCVG